MYTRRNIYLTVIAVLFFTLVSMSAAQSQPTTLPPLRLAVAGITHGHAGWILGRKEKKDVTLVGIYESNTELKEKYAKMYSLPKNLFYSDMKKMLDAVKPEAVVAFGSIYEHMEVVEVCAPRGIHVMVEKPLATNIAHAKRMEQLARENKIFLLTNYETSWYPTTVKTFQLVNDSNYIGAVKKIVVHDGHQGPKEIGVSKEFLDWLTDPVQNGGGALIDFGCYGANLSTYLMRGQQPVSVTAITQQLKPSVYPKVDDEATIIVTYPAAQVIIQASWNWPFSRKDMEVYGENGYIFAENSKGMRLKNRSTSDEKKVQLKAGDVDVYGDPFSYLADVIRGKIQVEKNGLYSLENNIMVVRILDAARESAKSGKTVLLKDQK